MSSLFRNLAQRCCATLGMALLSAPLTSAAASPRVLRVCADPGNLPFSDDHLRGFENKIAAVIARELHAELRYVWWAQRRGFLRNTLNARECDLVIGVPAELGMVRTTRAYYRSTFAFVSRVDHPLADLSSLDDGRLRTLKIGVPLAGDDGANPAPVMALSRRGIVTNVVGFSLWNEHARVVPAAVEAVAQGSLDVAVLWGPVAGAAADNRAAAMRVRPVAERDDAGVPLAFSIAMGVRRDDVAFAAELDALIVRKQSALVAILRRYHVPLLELPLEESNDGKP